ncbi:hypothetical protein A6V29_09260 [Blastococcus sp. CCUG 61487]|nr:hypothetical protein A6V29_09260 [Blastococcus sp. CCUG 61487]
MAVLGLVLPVLGLASPAGTEAAFSATSGSATSFSSAADWLPPVISRTVVLKEEGGIPGYIRPNGQYRVHAAVVDDPSSNPPSGLGAVTAGLTGLPTMALGAGAATVAGQSYTHQTPWQTVPSYAPAGTYEGWVRASDLSTPAHTSADVPVDVVVDTTAPSGTSVAIVNGGVVRRPDAGDRVTVTWGEVVDPHSVVTGWTGAAMDVTVRITNSIATGGDVLTIWNAANSAQLPLGQVTLGGNYVSATTTFGAAGAATRSRLSWAAAPGTQLLVTLGPPNVAGNVVTSTTAGTLVWTPSATVYDRAGNRSTTTAVAETGTADRDF